MTKRILIVGAGGNQIAIIRKAREMGLTTIAVDGNPDAPGFAIANAAEAVNILDPNELTRIAQKHDVHGIYPTAELAVEAVADAATRLGLPGAVPEVATRVRNKLIMRQALKSQGIPGTAFSWCPHPGRGASRHRGNRLAGHRQAGRWKRQPRCYASGRGGAACGRL